MEDHQETRIERATESTLAKFLARFLTPILLSIVAYLGIGKLNAIQAAQDAQATIQTAQSVQINDVKTEVKLLNAKVDYSVLQLIYENRRRIELLEAQSHILRPK